MKRIGPACRGFVVVLGALVGWKVEAADLPGFKLEGDRWTYQEGDLKMDGILVKPAGEGPFPAILISHGLGGNAESFGVNKAREMVKWGFVCMAPNYTHSRNNLPARGPSGPPRNAAANRDYGASDENLRRAAKCLDILVGFPYVDNERLAAYGHSMGGFVTLGLAAREPKRLKAAAISGSGIAPRAGYAAPSSEAAAKIRTPLVMFHGGDDTAVRPDQSASLKEVLDRNGVVNERHVYDGVGHPVDQQRAREMLELMQAWFRRHKVLAAR